MHCVKKKNEKKVNKKLQWLNIDIWFAGFTKYPFDVLPTLNILCIYIYIYIYIYIHITYIYIT